jgi:hypothetical protein
MKARCIYLNNRLKTQEANRKNMKIFKKIVFLIPLEKTKFKRNIDEIK